MSVFLFHFLLKPFEPVSDLTTDAFIAALRCFTARCGKPSLILSDHGTNFAGATRELKEIYHFIHEQKTRDDICFARMAFHPGVCPEGCGKRL